MSKSFFFKLELLFLYHVITWSLVLNKLFRIELNKFLLLKLVHFTVFFFHLSSFSRTIQILSFLKNLLR